MDMSAYDLMPTEELLTIHKHISNMLASKLSLEAFTFCYINLKDNLIQHRRYSKDQLLMFRPFTACSVAKKKEITKAYVNALTYFNSIGLPTNQKTLNFINLMVTKNLPPYQLSISDVIALLHDIETLFKVSYPGYLSNGGIEILKRSFQDGAAIQFRSIASKSHKDGPKLTTVR